MTFIEAIDEILEKVGAKGDESNPSAYLDLAKQIFRDSVISLSKSADNEDILSLLTNESSTVPGNGVLAISDTTRVSLTKVLKIFSDPNATSEKALFIELSLDAWGRIGTDSNLEPLVSRKEVFWCKIGNEIHFYKKNTAYAIRILALNTPAAFNNSEELLDRFSEDFINKVEKLTIVNLLASIKMENPK
jgi:hypothetical protein